MHRLSRLPPPASDFLKPIAVAALLGAFIIGNSSVASAQVSGGGPVVGPGGTPAPQQYLAEAGPGSGTGVTFYKPDWSYSFDGDFQMEIVPNPDSTNTTTWKPAYRGPGTDTNNPNSNKPLRIRVSMGANAPGGTSSVVVEAYVIVHNPDQTISRIDLGMASFNANPGAILTKYGEGKGFTGTSSSQFKLYATGDYGSGVLVASGGF